MSNHEHQPDLMTCMEVWGGNEFADQSITMMGLDAWMYSKPFGDSSHGGDIYYLSNCSTGRIIRLLVADISGHGKTAEKPAEKLRMLMRRYVNQIDQKRFVKAMNLSLTEFSSKGMFATTVVVTYFAPTGTLTLTNAGHPPPILFDAQTNTWSFLQTQASEKDNPTDIPLGILKFSEYETLAKRIQQGDIVLCYTDALIECRNEHGEVLGKQGLSDILNQLDIEEASEIIPTLMQTLSMLYPGNLKDDDVTLLVFTPNGLFETSYKKPSINQHIQMMLTIISKIMSKDEPVPWPDLHPANLGGAVFNILNKLWGRQIK